jgi:hypothetical protein
MLMVVGEDIGPTNAAQRYFSVAVLPHFDAVILIRQATHRIKARILSPLAR